MRIKPLNWKARFWRYATGVGLIWASALGPVTAQISPEDLLPVEEAFALSVTRTDQEIQLVWDIAPGYYLYRHALKFSANVALGEPDIPKGKVSTDEFFGETETYRETLQVRVPLADAFSGAIDLQVVSQGCADLGVCYPPHRVRLTLDPLSTSPSTPSLLDPSADAGLDNVGLGEWASGNAGALPAEQAFRVEAIATGASEILVRFTSSSNYYVYLDSLGFSIEGGQATVSGVNPPPGEFLVDEYFGRVEVFFDEVEIPLLISRTTPQAQSVSMAIQFQGCLKDGICYPPMERFIVVDLPVASSGDLPAELGMDFADEAGGLAEQDRLAQALAQTPILALGLFLVAGILLAFTPCVFPMVPILSGLIAGEGEQMNTARAFRLSLVYVLSMALVYTAFGVVAGVFGQNLQAVFQHPLVLIAFAALFVALALAMFGFYELQLPTSVQTRLNEWSNRAEGGTLWGAAIMGALSALVVGPCVAPALMGALIYIGQTGDAVLGGAALFSMAIGMGIPLMVWGTSAGRWLPRAGGWMNTIKAVFGVGLLALAIWMLERILPGGIVMMLWGSLALGVAIFLRALSRLEPNASGWVKLGQVIGVVLLIIGAVQWVGALSGGRDWLRPLAHWSADSRLQTKAPTFLRVETLAELEAVIADSPQPVFLDFYADWCVDCVRMERRTFVDASVAQALSAFALVKVDVTDYNQDHQAILSHFGLIGPPALLFFSQGQELRALRRFGFMPPDEFIDHLNQVSSTHPAKGSAE